MCKVLNFLKTPNYDFNGVFMDYTEDVVFTTYFAFRNQPFIRTPPFRFVWVCLWEKVEPDEESFFCFTFFGPDSLIENVYFSGVNQHKFFFSFCSWPLAISFQIITHTLSYNHCSLRNRSLRNYLARLLLNLA